MKTRESIIVSYDGLKLVTLLNYNILKNIGVYNKTVYFTKGFPETLPLLGQILGNFGAFPQYKIDTECNYIVIADAIIDNPESGLFNEFKLDLETKLNASKSGYQNVLLITEKQMIAYISNRINSFKDEICKDLLDEYKKGKRQMKGRPQKQATDKPLHAASLFDEQQFSQENHSPTATESSLTDSCDL